MPSPFPAVAGTLLHCRIELPANYRLADFLAFHRRDSQDVAERVTSDSLTKGLRWENSAACLHIRFKDKAAEVQLDIDGGGNPAVSESPLSTTLLEHRARLMLGLTQPVEEFEQQYRGHCQLGALIRSVPGLRIPLAASPFEALSWAIIGQQISVQAAVSIRRRLIQAAGQQHSSGLWCYPDARQTSNLSDAGLGAAGLSAAKVRTFRALCEALESGLLQLDAKGCNAEQLGAQLLQIKGIGPWTVNYALMRGFGWPDGSLHGDVAVRRSLQALLAMADKPTERQTQDWLADFSPWRALVAAHLWALDARVATDLAGR
ncbi:3-methyladenine DNA glycosylase 2 [Marinobacterium aestuarii]|uniref:DNA-3-methyladenine glycosylase II n=1 Tax=Marinobacterium aestuarii TaxID=1821621 RepID=A0A1A9EYQ6_9GAMM|nr:DNA-3-methyladenine glycosylase 2 [Marinobacterium aestuarii]ANG63025.1 3-methyladenine DNA glycosylase 2 [Marinobacterium aestuarii]